MPAAPSHAAPIRVSQVHSVNNAIGMTGAMSGAGDRRREACLVSNVTCETTQSDEELRLPAALRDDEEARREDTYLLKGVPVYALR